jgi:excinuclease ABC subunit C
MSIKDKRINRLKKTISVLPEKPGVYEYFDKNGTLIYVGKAKNLRKRVASYFTKSHDSAKTAMLVSKIEGIEHVVVASESEALLLENSFIKKHQPRYNVFLKDDKTYPWICVKKEHFPRVFMTRKIVRDGSQYYGPYTSVRPVRTILEFIRKMYKLRSCKYNLSPENIEVGKYKVCLEYHIGNCLGPCEGKQGEEEYDRTIEEIKHILRGNVATVARQLKDVMMGLAAERRFEDAADLKARIDELDRFRARSEVVSPTTGKLDVFSIVSDDKYGYVNYLKVANGAIIQAHTVELRKKLDEPDRELLELAIVDIRESVQSDSREIVVPFHVDMEQERLKYTVPRRGDKRKLLELSQRNANFHRLEKLKQLEKFSPDKHVRRIMDTMTNDLRLDAPPKHIECFDNSNIQGHSPVAACVVFRNGKPSKKEYRHYHIKTVEGPDDFASMQEVVFRRYRRMKKESEDLPQLIVIDGGKGQLSAAVSSLERLNLRGEIAIIGIAKKLEEIYFPNDPVPLYLDKNSETLKIIQHLRNEAHRFGITFHRKTRSRAFTHSELDDIAGIGKKSKQQLLKHFGSLKKIKEASPEELEKAIGAKRMALVWAHFHGTEGK